ncbi:MAG: aldehyde dehydrogenase [Microthrixaceae bacterium]
MTGPFTEGLDRHLIDGQLLPAPDSATFESFNPATEQVVGRAADGTANDMDSAIDAARRAFDAGQWSNDPSFRASCIRQLQAALVAHGEEMRDLTTAEAGAPAFLTAGPQFDAPVEALGFSADLAENYTRWSEDLGEASPMGVRSRRAVLREPAGVVGAITPWNFPHQINFAKLGPALAAGCTVVLKPAPDTPLCASAVARIVVEETDIPDGVLNVVNSRDHSIGAQLSGDPRVDIVSFTGSTNTGRAVMRNAAENLTKVFLELGGKSAFIILDDADIGAAASMAAFMVSTHAGQGCAITTRLVVPRSRMDEVVDTTAATMGVLTAGDPTDPGTVCGPLISARQRERVEGYLTMATEEGGKFACGGGRSTKFEQGYFIDPTLIVGLDNNSRVAREEIFGPVLVVIPHDGDEDAISIANDSPYGLSGAVYSGDEERAWNVTRRVRTGTMAVNGGVWYGGDVPFGGYKASGIGREMGVAGFEEYLEIKSVAEGI